MPARRLWAVAVPLALLLGVTVASAEVRVPAARELAFDVEPGRTGDRLTYAYFDAAGVSLGLRTFEIGDVSQVLDARGAARDAVDVRLGVSVEDGDTLLVERVALDSRVVVRTDVAHERASFRETRVDFASAWSSLPDLDIQGRGLRVGLDAPLPPAGVPVPHKNG